MIAAMTLLTVVPQAQSAQAVDLGSTKGHLQIGGQHITITHAYAFLPDDAEGSMGEWPLRLMFTDHPLPPTLIPDLAMDDQWPIKAWAEQNHASYLLLETDPRHRNNVKKHVLGAEHSVGVQTNADRSIKQLRISNHRVAGKLRFRGTARDSYGYAISFDAPLSRPAPVTAKLRGPAALESPPAQALLAYEQACRQGDADAAKQAMSPHKLWLTERMAEGYHLKIDELIKALAKGIPEASEREKQIRQVVIRGERATLLGPGNQPFQTLRKDGGAWKVD
jgi:hypothetical protein